MGRNNLIVCNNEDSFATRGLVRQVVSRLLNAPLLKLFPFFLHAIHSGERGVR